jgi:hypothetical protein
MSDKGAQDVGDSSAKLEIPGKGIAIVPPEALDALMAEYRIAPEIGSSAWYRLK